MKYIIFTFLLASSLFLKTEGPWTGYQFNSPSDSTVASIQVRMENNRPVLSKEEIRTEVCITGECKLAELTLFWDGLGHFHHFEISEERPLTKYEHSSFEEKDYTLLHEILSRENSVLKNYSLKELIVPAEDKSYALADGVSGATIKTIQKDIVPAAAYTTHTLWHIANGWRSDSLFDLANRNFVPSQLPDYLKHDDYRFQEFGFQKWADQLDQDPKYLTAALALVAHKNTFFAQRVFMALENQTLGLPQAQQEIFRDFAQLDYRVQSAILKRMLGKIALHDESLLMLIKQLPQLNIKHMVKILETQKSQIAKSESLKQALQHIYQKSVGVQKSELRLFLNKLNLKSPN